MKKFVILFFVCAALVVYGRRHHGTSSVENSMSVRAEREKAKEAEFQLKTSQSQMQKERNEQERELQRKNYELRKRELELKNQELQLKEKEAIQKNLKQDNEILKLQMENQKFLKNLGDWQQKYAE